MKSNIIKILIYSFLSFFVVNNLHSEEIFNFEVSEIEIIEDGNIFKGYKGGKAFTKDKIFIEAENFEYNKTTFILVAENNVILNDKIRNIKVEAEKILYNKKEEIIIADGNVVLRDNKKNLRLKASKILINNKNREIEAFQNVEFDDLNLNIKVISDKALYFENENKIVVNGNVKFNDLINNISLNADEIIYQKDINKIYSKGLTTALIESKYSFKSKDVVFLKDEMRLFSSEKTIIKDSNNNLYELDSFDYQVEKEFLKGENILVTENYKMSSNEKDKYFFKSGFIDFKNKYYKTGPAKIFIRKNIFDRSDNDPRIYGQSSSHKNGVTTLKKAVFTSCKRTDKCPPWQIEASEIKHDKNKKQIIYDNSILKLYDVPIFYFPKFFHPDPTVDRQSGFLLPKLSNSNILGSSISTPYFHVISENKDMTFNPTLFSKNTKMIQTEYRQENKHSSLIADVGLTNGFKTSSTNKKENINHIFAKLEKKINLSNFLTGELNFFLERVSKDTYLKIFSDYINNNVLKPNNTDVLKSGLDFDLEHSDYSISGGAEIYEDLSKIQSDRYQYVMPYYNYSHQPLFNNFGTIEFDSSGNNVLENTNQIESRIINNFKFSTNDKIFENFGLKNNVNFYLKNLNSLGKNSNTYKSSPQIELLSLIEMNTELPMIKESEIYDKMLTPKLSLRINPGEMKNHSTDKRNINASNIFNINRLGIDDSFESGNSLTFGVDYKKTKKDNSKKYIEYKFATVFRDENEPNISPQTSLNDKNSYLFGSIDNKMSEYLKLNYNFAIDNNIENFMYNSIGLNFSLNNFVTEFNFIEEESDLGNTNLFENVTKYQINENNSFGFKTRKNREINLTEYYDLVYEYNNDCLTAGVRYKKTYYEDRDLKPSENLMFTISFYPLTTIQQSVK